MKAYVGTWIKPLLIFTMAVDGVSDQLHALAALILDNNSPPPDTHLLGGGMEHRVVITLNKKSFR
jgi:hypothetical protein